MYQTKNYLLEETKHNDLVNEKKNKRVCRALDFF